MLECLLQDICTSAKKQGCRGNDAAWWHVSADPPAQEGATTQCCSRQTSHLAVWVVMLRGFVEDAVATPDVVRSRQLHFSESRGERLPS